MFRSPRKLADLTGADAFVLGLDRLMQRRGQSGLIGQTHVVLEGVPDLGRLQQAADRLSEHYPLLNALVVRRWFSLAAEWHAGPQGRGNLRIGLWRERGLGVENAAVAAAVEVGSAQEWAEDVLNEPLENRGARNLRIDVMFLRGGGTQLVLTWSHLLFDGKGAELLLRELVRALDEGWKPVDWAGGPARSVAGTLRQRLEAARPMVDHFYQLVVGRVQSLSGRRAVRSALRFEVMHWDAEATSRIKARSAQLCGSLFNVGFYLACAARAHRQAFLCRGKDPEHYVVSIPVQVRRKGGSGNPFHNSVTVLFFSLRREDLLTLEGAVQAAQRQFEDMTRRGLDRAFLGVLDWMRLLPAGAYMRFVRAQFSGEVSSFFHSFTGNFAEEFREIAGALVRNAYHVPSVSAPPGSGLFFGIFGGQLSATLSWREGAASSQELEAIRVQLGKDFSGVS